MFWLFLFFAYTPPKYCHHGMHLGYWPTEAQMWEGAMVFDTLRTMVNDPAYAPRITVAADSFYVAPR